MINLLKELNLFLLDLYCENEAMPLHMEVPSALLPQVSGVEENKADEKRNRSATPATMGTAYRQHTTKFNIGLLDCLTVLPFIFHKKQKKPKVDDVFWQYLVGKIANKKKNQERTKQLE